MGKQKCKLLILIIGNTLLFQMFVAGVSSAKAKADDKFTVVLHQTEIQSTDFSDHFKNKQDVRKIRKGMVPEDGIQ